MVDKETKSTMREFAANDEADYYSGITSIMKNGKNAYELKGKFLDDFHKNAFSRTHGEDAVEHIEYFLNIGIGYRQKDEKRSQIGQNRARIWKELKKSKVKAKVNPDKVKSKPKSTPTKSKSKEKSKQSQNTTLGTEFAKSLKLDFKDLKTKVILCDHVLHPLAPHYERKTRSDHGTKRCRQSNPSSSSNALDHSSSSHHVDENVDENDESSHSNTPSPSQLINYFSNVVPRVFENPPYENQIMHTYQTEILNHQSQHQDEHRKGLRSIGRALKNAMRGSKK
ncbi:hypothetical protein Tco_0771403 [Tanacetum coccineum]|uniref:Uncharacterized protein n=1 Tax=Tanacetum coccineum TaxID=301880 RepID=A0ABQ4ZIH9_9ASTR